MNYLGDFAVDETIYILFHTFDSNGASVTITGLATSDIEVYKDGGTTQRNSDSGYSLLDTDGIDFDSLTGIHGFSIDLSDNSDAGFYAAGSEYTVVVSSITVDGQTVSFIAATFSIERDGAALSLLKNATYGLSAIETLVDELESRLTAVRAGYLDNLNGHTPQTGDNYARLGAPAGASVSADIAAIEAQTDDIGVAGAGLTNIPWNSAWDLEVQSEVEDGLSAYTAPTLAQLQSEINDVQSDIAALNDPAVGDIADAVWDEAKAGHVALGSFGEEVQAHSLSSEIAALNDVSAAEVNAEVDTAIEDYHLDHLFATAYDATFKPGAADALLNEMVEDDSGVTRYTANALEEAPTGGSAPTVAEIADGVWDEQKSGHVASGSFGEEVQDHSLSSEVAALNDLSSAEVGDAVLDEIVEGTYSLRELMRLTAAALFGKVSGGGTTTVTFRDTGDATNRIVATVDANGNRTAVTLTET